MRCVHHHTATAVAYLLDALKKLYAGDVGQLDDPVLCQIRDEILGLDINNLTPVEALNKLNEIKKIVTGRS